MVKAKVPKGAKAAGKSQLVIPCEEVWASIQNKSHRITVAWDDHKSHTGFKDGNEVTTCYWTVLYGPVNAPGVSFKIRSSNIPVGMFDPAKSKYASKKVEFSCRGGEPRYVDEGEDSENYEVLLREHINKVVSKAVRRGDVAAIPPDTTLLTGWSKYSAKQKAGSKVRPEPYPLGPVLIWSAAKWCRYMDLATSRVDPKTGVTTCDELRIKGAAARPDNLHTVVPPGTFGTITWSPQIILSPMGVSIMAQADTLAILKGTGTRGGSVSTSDALGGSVLASMPAAVREAAAAYDSDTTPEAHKAGSGAEGPDTDTADSDADVPVAKSKGKAKGKAKAKAESESESESEDEAPVVKSKGKSKSKAKPKPESESEDEAPVVKSKAKPKPESDDEAPVAKSKGKSKAKPKPKPESESEDEAPVAKSKGKAKAKPKPESESEDEAPVAKSKGKGKAKAKAEPESEDSDAAPPAKSAKAAFEAAGASGLSSESESDSE